MKVFIPLVVMILALASVVVRAQSPGCPTPGRNCLFRLVNNALVKDGVIVGHVDSSGEARVFNGIRYVPISRWSPPGLLQKFSPSFIKVFQLVGTPRSTVGFETPQQNQLDFLDGLCFFLPLETYQVLDANGNVIDNVRGGRSDCIASRIVVT